jgi:hypothetical protein
VLKLRYLQSKAKNRGTGKATCSAPTDAQNGAADDASDCKDSAAERSVKESDDEDSTGNHESDDSTGDPWLAHDAHDGHPRTYASSGVSVDSEAIGRAERSANEEYHRRCCGFLDNVASNVPVSPSLGCMSIICWDCFMDHGGKSLTPLMACCTERSLQHLESRVPVARP